MPAERPPTNHEAAGSSHGEGSARATAEVVSLDRVAEATVGSIHEWVARRTQYLREWVAGGIMVVFILANAAVLWIVLRLVQVDQDNIAAHLIAPSDRIITNQVIMALLGATAAQVGAIAVIIARYLFPGEASAEGRR